MVNIAVLGYGTVGSGVVEVINTNHKSINKRAGAEINVKYVLDLRDFPGDPVEKVLVHDYEIKQSAGCEAWSGADGNRKRKEHQLLI